MQASARSNDRARQTWLEVGISTPWSSELRGGSAGEDVEIRNLRQLVCLSIDMQNSQSRLVIGLFHVQSERDNDSLAQINGVCGYPYHLHPLAIRHCLRLSIIVHIICRLSWYVPYADCVNIVNWNMQFVIGVLSCVLRLSYSCWRLDAYRYQPRL